MQKTSRRRAIGTAIAAAVALAAVVLWLMPHPTPAAPEPAPAAEKAEKRPLQLSDDEARRAGLLVRPLDPANGGETLSLFGAVEPNKDRLARITAPVAGRLIEVRARLGDTVKPGDALAILESPESGEAQAAYAQTEAELTVALRSLERTRALVAGGSLARKEEGKAQAEYDKARAARGAAMARLAALGIPPDGGAGRLVLAAPFAGAVIEKTAVLGEHVPAHQALFTVGDLSSLWIEAEIFERDLPRLALGAEATVTVAAFPDRRFAGSVRYLSSGLDRETRTAKARIELANPEGLLKPGMFAGIAVAMPDSKPQLRVPETALVLLQGQMTAFVRTGDGFEPRPVETGARSGGEIVVTSGLEAGDQVVMAGAYALKARLLKSQIGDAD